ncbi:unnamed protein product [Durusdinium trenchii]|uniref:Uncharacterized protein n=1 Tax=Durusdinium trenchii TaxID=1381693 RepID=A0ABP0HTB3_9DINO
MAAQLAYNGSLFPLGLYPRDHALGLRAVKRLREGFAFVGLTEEWDLSICLFHTMFGGPCHSSEFHNARKSHHLKNADGSYDTSVLQGYQDEIDGLVYAEGLRMPCGRMMQDVYRTGVNMNLNVDRVPLRCLSAQCSVRFG